MPRAMKGASVAAVIGLSGIGGCGGTPPGPAAPIVAEETAPTTPVLASAACADGRVLPRGSSVPAEYARFGRVLDGPGVRGEVVVRGVCAIDDAIKACWTAAVERKDAGGSFIIVELRVDASGAVTEAKRAGGTVEAAALVACLESAFAGAKFTKDAAGIVQYRLGFRTKVVVMREVGTAIEGQVEPGEVKQVLRANFPRLRGCYEALSKKSKRNIYGTLTFDLMLRSDGSVESLNVDYTDEFGDKQLLECAAGIVKGLSFPAPKLGKVRVHYPLSFSAWTEE